MCVNGGITGKGGETFILLPTLSGTIIVVETGLTLGFWERCEHQGGFSVIGFLESKVNMDTYLAMARHFPLWRAPGPGNYWVSRKDVRVPRKNLA